MLCRKTVESGVDMSQVRKGRRERYQVLGIWLRALSSATDLLEQAGVPVSGGCKPRSQLGKFMESKTVDVRA